MEQHTIRWVKKERCVSKTMVLRLGENLNRFKVKFTTNDVNNNFVFTLSPVFINAEIVGNIFSNHIPVYIDIKCLIRT